jgi:hypothetical protein
MALPEVVDFTGTEGGGVEPLSLSGHAALQAAPSTGESPSAREQPDHSQ